MIFVLVVFEYGKTTKLIVPKKHHSWIEQTEGKSWNGPEWNHSSVNRLFELTGNTGKCDKLLDDGFEIYVNGRVDKIICFIGE